MKNSKIQVKTIISFTLLSLLFLFSQLNRIAPQKVNELENTEVQQPTIEDKKAIVIYNLPKYAKVIHLTYFYSGSDRIPLFPGTDIKIISCASRGFLLVSFHGVHGFIDAFATDAFYAYQTICMKRSI